MLQRKLQEQETEVECYKSEFEKTIRNKENDIINLNENIHYLQQEIQTLEKNAQHDNQELVQLKAQLQAAATDKM